VEFGLKAARLSNVVVVDVVVVVARFLNSFHVFTSAFVQTIFL
jgi:hypothetical protein